MPPVEPMIPPIALSMVVLPAPFGPMSATHSPVATLTLTPSSATAVPTSMLDTTVSADSISVTPMPASRNCQLSLTAEKSHSIRYC